VKGISVPPAGKNRGLALALVAVMALATLVAALMPFLTDQRIIGSLLSNPVYLGLDALNLLLALLVYLKFVLPGWEPHRKVLGWLLGLSILSSLAFSIFSVFQGFNIGLEAAGGLGGDPTVSGIVNGSLIVGGVIGGVAGIVINPFFWLLIGIWKKKSMEKIAGVVSIVSLGFSLLSVLLTTLLGSLSAGVADLPETLWTSTVPALVSTVCAMILYFSWPVLSRPVLEKPDPASPEPFIPLPPGTQSPDPL